MSPTLTHLGHSVTGGGHKTLLPVPIRVFPAPPLPDMDTDPRAYERVVFARNNRVHALYERSDQLYLAEIFPAENYQNDLWDDSGIAKLLNGFSLATPIVLPNQNLGSPGIVMLYRETDGATRIINLRPDNLMSLDEMEVHPSNPTVIPVFAPHCTSFVSGVFLGDTFPKMFVMSYRADDGLTQFHFQPGDGSPNWFTTDAFYRLPTGIQAMAILTQSNVQRDPGISTPFLATVSQADLVIYQLWMGVDRIRGPLSGVEEVYRRRGWADIMNVRSLSSLQLGIQREHLVAYDPLSGKVRVDNVVLGPLSAGVLVNSTTKGVTDSWPAASLVGTLGDRVVRYSPRDGSTDYYRL